MTNAEARGFGVYVHSPFCVHKCSYCDFYSFTRYGEPDFSKLLGAWKREIEEAARWMGGGEEGGEVATVFFGGGTPSLLPPSVLGDALEELFRSFRRAGAIEITLEANPETVTPSLAREWFRLGFNRVSLGAQSFEARHLAMLERLGSAESIRRAAASVKEAGFEDFNLDLIFGIPEQTAREVVSDVEQVAALSPTHVSLYNLTLKAAHKASRNLPSDDTAAELYERGRDRLYEAGYERYEISNFARPGRECRHNLLYWSGGDFLGIGPSASSRFFRNGRFLHRKQVADFPLYVQAPKPMEFEATDFGQTVLEATFLELRKREGIRLKGFGERYGYDLTRAKRFAQFVEDGFLSWDSDTLRLTEKGLLLGDSVTRDLVDSI